MDAHDGLRRLATYAFVLASWVDEDGYPMNAVVEPELRPDEGTAAFAPPAGLRIPDGAEVGLTGSHIRPQPGYGYDQRRHVTVWGRASRNGDGLEMRAERAWGWDEAETPFFEYSERSAKQSKRYFASLSEARGRRIGPRLQRGWLFLRATRLPFLSATFIPVLLGIAVAARAGTFDLVSALLTVVAAAAVHLGLNVANDVFDTIQGADDANVTPTKYSGGSRVLQYGLVSLRGMIALAVVCYALAFVIGVALLAMRGSPALVAIAAVGFVISVGYTMPPVKLVYRGLGEIATAIGFGPVMLLGAYTVQTRGALSWEAFAASIPVAVLVALILYVNEVPDRRSDAEVGKRTLPVRWSKAAVIRGFDVSVVIAFLAVAVGVAVGILPVPALLALLPIPLARQVHRGLVTFYDQPFALMASLGTNVQLHMTVGGLLLAGYAVAIVAQQAFSARLFLW